MFRSMTVSHIDEECTVASIRHVQNKTEILFQPVSRDMSINVNHKVQTKPKLDFCLYVL
jgi:hypothetical protein